MTLSLVVVIAFVAGLLTLPVYLAVDEWAADRRQARWNREEQARWKAEQEANRGE
jgi:hypothetical protein